MRPRAQRHAHAHLVFRHPIGFVVGVGVQPARDVIVARAPRIIAQRAAAARRQRQVVARALVIRRPPGIADRPVLGHFPRRGERPRRGDARRQLRDLARDRDIAIHQCRRHAEHVSDIVEAVARIVLRQVARDIHVQRQQVADRIGIFDAIQPPDRRTARVGMRRGITVQRILQPGDERGALRRRGLRAVARRHLADRHAAQDRLPLRSMGADRRIAPAQIVDRQTGHLVHVIVAARAELAEHRGRGVRRVGADRRGDRHRRVRLHPRPARRGGGQRADRQHASADRRTPPLAHHGHRPCRAASHRPRHRRPRPACALGYGDGSLRSIAVIAAQRTKNACTRAGPRAHLRNVASR